MNGCRPSSTNWFAATSGKQVDLASELQRGRDLLELNGNDLRREPFEAQGDAGQPVTSKEGGERALIDLPIDLLAAHLDAVVFVAKLILASTVIALANRCDGYGAERLPQRARVCGLAWSSAAAEFDRGQGSPGRDIQARQPLFAAAPDQRRQRQSAALKGDQSRSLGDRTAPAAAEPGCRRGAGEQDRAHGLGCDAAEGKLPAHGRGGLGLATSWSLRESNDA
jgi:hypothetical protein